MKLTFIFRKSGVGHSLETLFEGVMSELTRKNTVLSEKLSLPFMTRGLWTVGRNIWFVWHNKPDFVHITGDIHYISLITKPLKTVLTIADCVLLERTSRFSLRYYIFWLFWYYLPMRRSSVITTISEKTRCELYKCFGQLADKVVVVPCHYNPVFIYSPKVFNVDCPTFLHIGTAPHKNLRRLVQAIEGFPCRLWIVGELSMTDLENLLQYKIDYEQYQNISQSHIVDLYRQCDLVTFVSLYEGFGMPVIEAQAMGRPVITSAIEPMSDIAADGACLVDPTDIVAIRTGIERICRDEAYREGLIKAGLVNVERFSLESVTIQYETLYSQLDEKIVYLSDKG